MDRFQWHAPGSSIAGAVACRPCHGVAIYEGEERTGFTDGVLHLYPTCLIWVDAADQSCQLKLDLGLVIGTEKKGKSFFQKGKVLMTLRRPDSMEMSVAATSSTNQVSLVFSDKVDDFYVWLEKILRDKAWELPTSRSPINDRKNMRTTRAGIAGIEKTRQEHHARAAGNIQQAFSDMKDLVSMAKPMVALANSIAEKLQDSQGDITDDDTIKFKRYLLGLGIADPVTRGTHGSGDQYYNQLAKELTTAMLQPLKKAGGMMTLTDVYCRLNRARGFELISPEDLFNAAQALAKLNAPIKLHRFDTGVVVLTLVEATPEMQLRETIALVEKQTSVTAEELAQILNLSVLLAKERLLYAEHQAKLCRDETVEGVRFFPNYILQPRRSSRDCSPSKK